MIKVDPEFKALIPPLSAEEYKQLEKNILARGIRDPLVVWEVQNGDQIILDGHNRFEIAQKHGLQFKIDKERFKGNDREQAKIWMIENQLGRRNLEAFQKVELILVLEPLKKAEAEKRMKAGKADPTQNSADGRKGETRDELARLAGVSHHTIEEVKAIKKEKNEELEQVLRKGGMTIHAAKGLLSLPAEAQKPIIQAALSGKLPKAKVPSAIRNAGNQLTSEKKICVSCNRELPLSAFEPGRNKCKHCRKAVVRERERIEREKETDAVNSWFQNGETAFSDIEKIVTHFNTNFDKYLDNLIAGLKYSAEEVEKPENADAIVKMFDRAIALLEEKKRSFIK